MFGLIISGRPVNSTPQSISPTQFAFSIPSTPSFNHIVVFILPGIQLPPGTAASVYVQVPPSTEFKFLGGIGPGKESAIFRITGLKSNTTAEDVMVDGNGSVNGEIAVGISIEDAAQVETQMANLASSTGGQGPDLAMGMSSSDSSTALVRRNPDRASTKVLAQRIIGNAFNFLASFGSDVVPLKAFQDWWQKFEKKIDLDPSFLERVDQG